MGSPFQLFAVWGSIAAGAFAAWRGKYGWAALAGAAAYVAYKGGPQNVIAEFSPIKYVNHDGSVRGLDGGIVD